jgi:hypothetical protein
LEPLPFNVETATFALYEGTSCDDGQFCTMDDVWANSICAGTYQVRSYGNILVQPGDDGLPDIGDLLCCLDGFRIALECPEADIAPCGGNGEIDIGDVLAMLDAFTGLFACPTPCPYRSAVYNPEPYTQVAGRCPGGTAKPRSVIPTGLRLPEAAPLPALKRWAILTACLRHARSPTFLHGANRLMYKAQGARVGEPRGPWEPVGARPELRRIDVSRNGAMRLMRPGLAFSCRAMTWNLNRYAARSRPRAPV